MKINWRGIMNAIRNSGSIESLKNPNRDATFGALSSVGERRAARGGITRPDERITLNVAK